MATSFNKTDYGIFTQILRRGVALGLCTTMLPFAQLNLLAQDAPPPQQSQYPYQDPGNDPAAQQNGQQGPPPQYGEQPNSQDGNGPAGPPPGYGEQGGYQGAPTAYQPQGPQQLEQLVAPIALYPDSLVAQVLAASTYPQQVQEANTWMQQYGNQPPEQLAQSANAMPWDPSVKALTQFPSVLQQLSRSSQWTIALGNAYYNQPADVMAAVQSMRYRAREAGQLRDTPQQVVVDDGPQIIIQPANPEVVYVPYYDPWVCYGAPISPFYGWYRPAPPIGFALGVGIGIGFGIGIGIAAFGHWGWGYHAWAPNWHSNTIIVNHNTYISRSTTVYNRGGYGAFNQGFGRGGPQGFAHASFNPHAALYNGRPMSAANRPPVNNAGFNRPGGPGANTLSRPNQPGNLNRPTPNGSAYNRPATANPGAYNRGGSTAPGSYNRPATGTSSYGRPNAYNAPANGGYNRPSGTAGSYNRPAATNGSYNRPSAGAYNRPAPSANYGGGRPQVQSAPRPSASRPSEPSHASAPRAEHEGGGGEHHGGGGGGEHHR